MWMTTGGKCGLAGHMHVTEWRVHIDGRAQRPSLLRAWPRCRPRPVHVLVRTSLPDLGHTDIRGTHDTAMREWLHNSSSWCSDLVWAGSNIITADNNMMRKRRQIKIDIYNFAGDEPQGEAAEDCRPTAKRESKKPTKREKKAPMFLGTNTDACKPRKETVRQYIS